MARTSCFLPGEISSEVGEAWVFPLLTLSCLEEKNKGVTRDEETLAKSYLLLCMRVF